MRGPDRKGVRGLTNMTDSHMVGGHKSSSDGARVSQQALSFLAIVVGAAGLYVIAAFLGSDEPALRRVALGVIGLFVLVAALAYVIRRRNRGSIDEAIRSRRQPNPPEP